MAQVQDKAASPKGCSKAAAAKLAGGCKSAKLAGGCSKAREAGAWTNVDAVQSVPHVSTDVQDLGCDFLVCSAYKFFGPHQGILWGRREVLEALEAYKVRPAPDTIPGCFETGTLSHEGMAGTTAAVDYLASIGEIFGSTFQDQNQTYVGRRLLVRSAMDCLFDYETGLSNQLIDAGEAGNAA